MNRVWFVVPEWIDDPQRPSGGNSYDRRVADELRALGWDLVEAHSLDEVPRDAVVMVDALIAPEVATHRGLVVLAHMPFEQLHVLPQAAAIITTSASTRARLLEQYPLDPQRTYVAPPGVDPADLVSGTPDGGGLLCVGVVAPHKGQDVLIAALATLPDVPWRCTCVGPLDRAPEFVAELRARPISARVEFAGPRTGNDLDRSYASADVLVLPSRAEAYGMVATEALARGVPVIASDVGGVPEAVGGAGLLVPADDPTALAGALRRWLTEPTLRHELRTLARERRGTLSGWAETARRVADALSAVERQRA